MNIRYKLIDSLGAEYIINDPTFKLLEEENPVEVDFVERSFRAGDDVPGIQRDQAKDLNFQYDTNDTEGNFRNYVNEFIKQCRKALYIRDTYLNIEAEIRMTSHTNAYDEGGFHQGAVNTITFRMLKPYWQDIEYTTITDTGTTADTYIINNTGYIETPAIFTLVALEAVTKYSIVRREDNFGIVVKDLQFGTEGLTTYIIDNADGTIELNGINRNETIVDGTGFFLLQPGVNTIDITTNGVVTVEIQYKRRYYV
jgi:hypothetical protein